MKGTLCVILLVVGLVFIAVGFNDRIWQDGNIAYLILFLVGLMAVFGGVGKLRKGG